MIRTAITSRSVTCYFEHSSLPHGEFGKLACDCRKYLSLLNRVKVRLKRSRILKFTISPIRTFMAVSSQ